MSAECSAGNIPPGYKQTEVGVIPEDWRTPTLGSLTVLMTNGFVGTATTHYANNDNGILYIQGYNVEENSFNFHGIKFVTEDFHSAHMKSCLRGGDLLTVQTGDVGLTTVVPESLAGSNCHALIISRFDQKQASPIFISYYLNSKPGRSRLKLIETGTTMKHLNVGDMLQFTVPLPPTKTEQEAIAECLGDADAFIESLEQLISKKRQIKQGAMQELLQPKEGWEPTSLGNIADPNQRWSFTGGPFGSNLKSSDYTDDGIRIIQLQNIGDGEFKNDYEVYTSIQKADELLSCNIYPGEIILSKMGDPVARACLIPPYKKRYLMCSDGIRLAVDQKRFNTYFVYTLINAPDFRMKAENASTGSTRKRIGLTELRNLELLCPSLPKQIAIAAILSDMDSEITALEEKLAKARQLKQGMMQELLTGRTRLL